LPYKDKELGKLKKREYYARTKDKRKVYELQPHVKERQRWLDSQRRLERKLEAIELLGGKCSACGGMFHPACYDFHHVNPKEKDFDPCSGLTKKKEVFFEELKKCVLLCANCHRLHHFKYETTVSSRKRKTIATTDS